MRHLRLPLALAVIGVVAIPSVIANADSSKSLDKESIQECISANRNLDVLMLVDERRDRACFEQRCITRHDDDC